MRRHWYAIPMLGLLLGVLLGRAALAQLVPLGSGRPAASGVIDAAAYGVVCNGSTDTTAALQAAITASKIGTTTGLVLSMPVPTGDCVVTGTLTITSIVGWELRGNGVRFLWQGTNATIPLFLLQDTGRAYLHNFQVFASSALPLAAVFQFENITGGTVTPSANVVENVNIECTNGGCTNGIVMAQGTGGDANNEFNQFKRVRISNVANDCALIMHSQSKTNVFEDFECSNNAVGAHVIENTHGSFRCIRCRGGGSTGADFLITNTNDVVSIEDGNFENSSRLFETGGASAADFPVRIINTRWAISNFLNADNRVILYQFKGPLILEGNKFEPATAGKALEIRWNAGGNFGSFVAIANYISSTLVNPFTGLQPTIQHSNLINRNDGNQNVSLGSTMLMPVTPAQTVTAGATILADACGGYKEVTAATAVTTNTTNTFEQPIVERKGCRMSVCNTGANAITLDQNANFLTADGNDIILAAATATLTKCVTVFQSGTKWIQFQ